MLDFLSSLSPTLQALCAGTITWLLTADGAATVLF